MSQNVQPMFAQALQYHGKGMISQAVQIYKDILKADPRYVPALHNMAIALWQQGQAKQALPYVTKAIARDPKHAQAHNTQGLIWASLFNFPNAEKSFSKALELQPDYAEVYFNLARLYFGQRKWIEAHKIAERLLELKPDHQSGRILYFAAMCERGFIQNFTKEAEKEMLAVPSSNPFISYLKGRIYFQCGDAEKAITHFDHALSLDKNDIPALKGKAVSLVELDRLEEAAVEYDRLLDVDPTNTGVLRLYARIHKFSEGDHLHERLKQTLKFEKKLADADKSELYHAWAKFYKDTGDKKKCFEYWTKAGKALSRTHDYDCEQLKEKFSQMRKPFPSVIRAHNDILSPRPIFILGMPRSGTTLMEQILYSHEDVTAGGELLWLKLAIGKMEQHKNAYEDASTLIAPAKKYTEWLAQKFPNAKIVTDKMPHNFAYLGYIYAMFPQAKIIHMQRNPMDTCLSCFGLQFQSGHEWSNDLFELGRFYKLYNEMMDHWRKVMPEDSFIEMRYEDLVSDLENESKRALKYCGLDWDESVLEFHKKKRMVQTASVHQVRKPIYNSSVERWREYKDELSTLLDELRPIMEKLGYKC